MLLDYLFYSMPRIPVLLECESGELGALRDPLLPDLRHSVEALHIVKRLHPQVLRDDAEAAILGDCAIELSDCLPVVLIVEFSQAEFESAPTGAGIVRVPDPAEPDSGRVSAPRLLV